MSEIDREAKGLIKRNLKSIITHAVAFVTGVAMGLLAVL